MDVSLQETWEEGGCRAGGRSLPRQLELGWEQGGKGMGGTVGVRSPWKVGKTPKTEITNPASGSSPLGLGGMNLGCERMIKDLDRSSKTYGTYAVQCNSY